MGRDGQLEPKLLFIQPPKLPAGCLGQPLPDVSTWSKKQRREWGAANIGLAVCPATMVVTAMAAVASLAAGFLNCGWLQVSILALNWLIAIPIMIFSAMSYIWIPYRRFNLDKYKEEYFYEPILPFPTRISPISVRCPKWMRLIMWVCVFLYAGFTVLLRFYPSGQSAYDAAVRAVYFGAAALVPAQIWFMAMGAYAAISVLLREAAEENFRKKG